MKAFPVYGQNIWDNNRIYTESGGMDLRDYFAIHATDYDIYKYQIDENNMPIRSRAEARYMFADAMMKAREQ